MLDGLHIIVKIGWKGNPRSTLQLVWIMVLNESLSLIMLVQLWVLSDTPILRGTLCKLCTVCIVHTFHTV